jgi:hypothetical protein
MDRFVARVLIISKVAQTQTIKTYHVDIKWREAVSPPIKGHTSINLFQSHHSLFLSTQKFILSLYISHLSRARSSFLRPTCLNDDTLYEKNPHYLPQFSRKFAFPSQTPKPGKTPPSTFKTVHLTSLAML